MKGSANGWMRPGKHLTNKPMKKEEVTLKPSKAKCICCGGLIVKAGISLSGDMFKYLKKNEEACLECYVDLAVEKSIKKKLK